ncbi:MAG: hypothetical protein BWY95_01216 [Bacteroidetes bacterium ADurb.BinA104]|nr:MAG: hypothetical protein BWY95_01216 [Bacteroidetes bacterium ADurb.BinA104]
MHILCSLKPVNYIIEESSENVLTDILLIVIDIRNNDFRVHNTENIDTAFVVVYFGIMILFTIFRFLIVGGETERSLPHFVQHLCHANICCILQIREFSHVFVVNND